MFDSFRLPPSRIFRMSTIFVVSTIIFSTPFLNLGKTYTKPARPSEGILDERGLTSERFKLTFVNETWYRGYSLPPSPLTTRPMSFIGDIFAGLGCGVFVAFTLPGYLALQLAVSQANVLDFGVETTRDEDFFIFPIHGSISHDGPVRVHYDVSVVLNTLGYTDVLGMTFGHDIFLGVGPPVDTEPTTFGERIRLLLHEFTHAVQYEAVGWFTPEFGIKYLYGYCRAGFSYAGNPMEDEAFSKQRWMDSLLSDEFGLMFYCVWKMQNLDPTLGLPIARVFTVIQSGPRVAELPFQFGVLQITETPLGFRVFTGAEIHTRNVARSSALPPCQRRTHMRKGGPDPPDWPIEECSEEDLKFTRIKNQAMKDWSVLSTRAFQSFNCRQFPTYPPGCPTSCRIHTRIPPTSHSCQFDPPPAGCDVDLNEENAWCRGEKDRCHQR